MEELLRFDQSERRTACEVTANIHKLDKGYPIRGFRSRFISFGLAVSEASQIKMFKLTEIDR